MALPNAGSNGLINDEVVHGLRQLRRLHGRQVLTLQADLVGVFVQRDRCRPHVLAFFKGQPGLPLAGIRQGVGHIALKFAAARHLEPLEAAHVREQGVDAAGAHAHQFRHLEELAFAQPVQVTEDQLHEKRIGHAARLGPRIVGAAS